MLLHGGETAGGVGAGRSAALCGRYPPVALLGGVRGGVLASGLLGGRPSSARGVTASGIVPRTVVPRPGEETISSSPPTAPTRSRIPIRPSPSPRSEWSIPTPSSADREMDSIPVTTDGHANAYVAARVLDRVLDRLRRAEIDRRLDRRRAASDALIGDGDRDRCRASRASEERRRGRSSRSTGG